MRSNFLCSIAILRIDKLKKKKYFGACRQDRVGITSLHGSRVQYSPGFVGYALEQPGIIYEPAGRLVALYVFRVSFDLCFWTAK